MEMNKFFEPKSIAIIGASEEKGKVGNSLIEKLLKFQGEIIPINPKHEFIFGKKSYSSVVDYPNEIDLAIIAIPSEFVNSVLEQCGKKKIQKVIIISAGFSESGNYKLEEQILKTSEKYKINILGPNCFGISNPELNLDTTFANSVAESGKISMISQSGALWSYIADLSKTSKIGICKFASLGNMAQLNFADFLEYLEEDEKTKRIILYIESLGKKEQGKRFIELAKKSKKEIIVVKAGSSKQGAEATISHTASLASEFKIYQGAFKQANIKQVSSLSEAFGIKSEIPSLIKEIKKIKNPKVAIVTNAGGAGALITDFCEANSIEVAIGPIDLIGTAKAEDYKNKILEISKIKNINAIIAILTPQTMSEPTKTAEEIIKIHKQEKIKIVPCFLGDISVKESKELFKKNKIQCFTKCI